MDKIDYLIRLRQYLKIIHHTKGRIRLDINLGIKKEKDLLEQDFNLDIKGIQEVKVNKILGKITINYDKDIIAQDDINTLFESDDKNTLEQIIKKYEV